MAKAGIPVFPGSPGSVSIRKNQAGSEYYVRRHYDGSGSQKEHYIGLVGEADAKAKRLREQIAEVKAMQKDVRLLIREGFQSADAPSYAKLACVPMLTPRRTLMWPGEAKLWPLTHSLQNPSSRC